MPPLDAGTVFPAGTGAGPFGRRLRQPRGARVPVLLVTGFLGAGKTTLVKALLECPEGRGTAVVVNEFGEIGIDDALLTIATGVAGAAAQVVLLGGGCLCCAVRSDLETTFRTLFADRARGAVPPFERVVLETSGADDPTPILQTFLSDRALAREYHLQAVVAVVDALNAADALDTAPEARRQVAIADRIVLTKRDLTAPNTIAALERCLRALNPHAPVQSARHGQVAPGFLLADSHLPHPTALAAEATPHTAGLATFTLQFETPFAWRTLTTALNLLCDLRGPDLLRVKGFVAVEGCRGPVVIQAVRHVLHRPLELEAWPDPTDRRSRLVFITRGDLQRAPVLDLFRAVLALTPPQDAP